MCDTKNSDVHNDSQKPYYSKVEVWSAVYAYHIGLGGSFGHAFKLAKIKDYVYWGLGLAKCEEIYLAASHRMGKYPTKR
eukprot:15315242-Ditylum_brightwellii.AAC.1